jgi:hypothetical protein
MVSESVPIVARWPLDLASIRLLHSLLAFSPPLERLSGRRMVETIRRTQSTTA